MEWTEEAISRLRTLWAEGHSTAEIGRRMGISKNAVVGKAHRLELPPRPSPIRREGSGTPRPPRRPVPPRVNGPTLPSMAAPPPPLRAAAPAVAQHRPIVEPARAPVPPPAIVEKPAMRPVPVARPSSRTMSCCWPLGEPGTPGFRFCDDPALAGKPYCGDHASLAYVKVRDRREEAA